MRGWPIMFVKLKFEYKYMSVLLKENSATYKNIFQSGPKWCYAVSAA